MKHSFVTQGLSVFDDFQAITEDDSVEYKKAAGKNGKGSVPNDFFESYSAMANTNGGTIILGIEQIGEKISILGIEEPERVVKELFDLLNNPKKTSINLLSSQRVIIREVHKTGKRLIFVLVPRASRAQKPVYIGQNPFTGTFRRNFEGDYLCPRDIVEKMIAEKVTESQDAKLLPHYGLDDLELIR